MRAHILLEPDPALWPARQERLFSVAEVLKALKYEPITYGPDSKEINFPLTAPADAENMETQLGVKNGHHAIFNEKVLGVLAANIKEKDIIIATEGWQETSFRGLLDATKGKFQGLPVIEYGIDYLDSFAAVRIFSSRHCLSCTSSDGKPKQDWIYAPMYIPVQKVSMFELPVYDEDSHPFRLTHLYAAGRGVPTVAPDWGIWAETIANGHNGVLYRTPKGRINAEEKAIKIQAQIVQAFISARYSLKLAATWVDKFLQGLTK